MASSLCSAALQGVSPLLTGQDITTCSHSWPYSASPGEQLQALSGSCGSQSVPQLPAPTTIWDCAGLHQCVLAETPSGCAMGRAHGADGSQGASGTSLSWTHCRDICGTRDCPSTQTAALCWAGALPSPVKGQLSTGDAGMPQNAQGKSVLSSFPQGTSAGTANTHLDAQPRSCTVWGHLRRLERLFLKPSPLPAPLGGCPKPRVPLSPSQPEQERVW